MMTGKKFLEILHITTKIIKFLGMVVTKTTNFSPILFADLTLHLRLVVINIRQNLFKMTQSFKCFTNLIITIII